MFMKLELAWYPIVHSSNIQSNERLPSNQAKPLFFRHYDKLDIKIYDIEGGHIRLKHLMVLMV